MTHCKKSHKKIFSILIMYISALSVVIIIACQQVPHLLRPESERSGRSHGSMFQAGCQSLGYRPSGPVTALASFPGSGNTWLRHLVQQATGFYTGSVYMDIILRRNGFPGEGITDGSVVVVKTHEHGNHVKGAFDKAILLLRQPGDAILAELNRRMAGHRGFVQKSVLEKTNFQEDISNMADTWLEFNFNWLLFDKPLHIVWYENLLTNLFNELQRILDFLQIHASKEALECLMMNVEGPFHRRKTYSSNEVIEHDTQKRLQAFYKLAELAIISNSHKGTVKCLLKAIKSHQLVKNESLSYQNNLEMCFKADN